MPELIADEVVDRTEDASCKTRKSNYVSAQGGPCLSRTILLANRVANPIRKR